MNLTAPLTAGGLVGGLGLGNLAHAVGDTVDAPRRWAWQHLFGTDSGSQLLSNTLGIDPEGTAGRFGGVLAEMLLDPVNLLGMAGLGRAGNLVGKAADSIGLRRAQTAAVGSELANVNRTRSAATGTLSSLSAAETAAEDAMAAKRALGGTPGVPSHVGTGYSEAALSELPDVTQLGNKQSLRSYRRVDPTVSDAIDRMGLGYQTSEGQFVYGKPSFARGSGGVLKPNGELPTNPLLEALHGGDAGAFDLSEVVAGSRGGGKLSGPMPTPTIGELFGGAAERNDMARAMPGAMSTLDGPSRHLVDMPLGEGLGFANSRASELRRMLLELQQQPQSGLESLLSRVF